MGSYFGKIPLEHVWEKKRCCKETQIAKYRIECEIKNLDYYSRGMDISELNKLEQPLRNILIDLLPFHSSNCGDVVQWIACDNCISSKPYLKKYFAYLANGWDENIKYKESYEKLNVNLSKL